MKKKTNSISINVLSVLVILVCLLLTIVTPVNSWFGDYSNNGVIVSVDIGDLKLKLYQNSVADANEVYSNNVNNDYISDNSNQTQPKYLVLNGEIVAGEPVDLMLILANRDLGSASMYVRFKFEIYVRGASGDTKINGVTLIGYDVPNATVNGFVEDISTGYYYYKNSSGENALLGKGQSTTLMKKFQIPLSCFVGDDGTMIYSNCESVYFKLVIDASVNKNFA